jgi:hypothetical protein
MNEQNTLSAFEFASVVALLEHRSNSETLDLMRKAEPGWSDATYHRRKENALKSLEQKRIISSEIVDRNIVWHLEENVVKFLPSEVILRSCLFVGENKDKLEAQNNNSENILRDLSNRLESDKIRSSNLEKELNDLKTLNITSIEVTLNSKFPKLGISSLWLRSFVLLHLIETMARQKLYELDSNIKPSDHMEFSQIWVNIRKLLPQKEHRNFEVDKKTLDFLYQYRSKMSHNGLRASFCKNEVEAIELLVSDIYQQLYKP